MDSAALSDLSIRTYESRAELPSVSTIERLYAAASQVPPLSEPPKVAASYARLYGDAKQRNDMVGVGAVAGGELIGFAYGYRWLWASETDEWSKQLRVRLGPDSAALIDESFAVLLLAIHPAAARRGLGTKLLELLMGLSNAQTYWLQTTDKDTPTLRLYRRLGYHGLGHGPDAPNGKPGLILVRRADKTR
ncbi:GNAT family N-acetyltransferase [Rathayibacter soli]|uniref:GNAT family N-acetyltransferase n=1 Tax=Rathayibacter soli TaxID=3144168 RepID=UPI0027E50ACE|nr:GNAT family N-acetyltransferase [Glaciibacter superstes]